jgi:L-seryl-tRNA(Ser) seleniumtransferase
VAGAHDLVGRCARSPLMRALRVGKLTLAALLSSCRSYLSDASLMSDNPTFAMLSRDIGDIRRGAERLAADLTKRGIACHVTRSIGQCGGGTLPDLPLSSYAVVLDFPYEKTRNRADRASTIFRNLHARSRPVIGVLREGNVLFDMLTVGNGDIATCAEAVAASVPSAIEQTRRPAP